MRDLQSFQEVKKVYTKKLVVHIKIIMRDCRISPSGTYQFIMTPLIRKLLSDADFVEKDTTYNENTELIYLFNATIFDYNTMKWPVNARIRSNEEDAEFYKNAFTLMFQTCKKDYPRFKLPCKRNNH